MDAGYGNALNVIRSVREYEKTGVAAFHLEDQISPKKCGHMEGKQLIASNPGRDQNQVRHICKYKTGENTPGGGYLGGRAPIHLEHFADDIYKSTSGQ